MVEVEPNQILLVYDATPNGWKEIREGEQANSIRAVLIQVQR
jgi:hypothetical protein